MKPIPRILRSLLTSPGVLPALLLVAAVAAGGIFAGQLTPYDPRDVDLMLRFKEPLSPGYPLGTDALGRDLLSRILYGARTSMLVGVMVALLAGSGGTLLGLIAGFYRGWAERLIMRLGDLQLGLPSFLLAIILLITLGGGVWNVIFALSIGGWITFARVIRSQVLSVRERDFVQGARAMGSSNLRLLCRHILPQCLTPLIVIGSFQVASAVLSEASLSFLGLGVNPEVPTWGLILSEGRAYMRQAWWVTTFPGLALMLTVLGINILGDWLRDYLDPKLRHASH